jgi:hypothetical protein
MDKELNLLSTKTRRDLTEKLVKLIKSKKSVNVTKFFNNQNIFYYSQSELIWAVIVRNAVDILSKEGLKIGII